jgi:hypothetical protein
VPLGGENPAQLEPIFDVLLHGEPAERGVLLEHHAAVAPDAFDALAVDEDLAARGRQQARHRFEDGRLAAAAGAEEDDDLADARLVGDIELDAAHRLDVVARLRAIDHVQIFDLQLGRLPFADRARRHG